MLHIGTYAFTQADLELVMLLQDDGEMEAEEADARGGAGQAAGGYSTFDIRTIPLKHTSNDGSSGSEQDVIHVQLPPIRTK